MAHAYQLGRARTRAELARENPEAQASRVYWDDKEKQDVASESFRFLQRDPAASQLDAINHAQQKVLRPERRRPAKTFAKFSPWIVPMWNEMDRKKETQATAAQNVRNLFEPAEQPPLLPAPELPLEAAPEVTLDAAPSSVADAPAENQTVVFADDGRVFQNADGTAAVAPSEPTRKPTVRWTDAEMRKLAARVHYLRKSFEDMSPVEALRKAVISELPDERHREIASWQLVAGWIEPMIEQIVVDEKLAEMQAKEAREEAERVAREQAEREEAIEARIREEVDARVTQQVEARMAQHRPVGLEAIIQLFALRFAETLVPAMSDAVMKAAALQIANISFGQPAKEEAKLVAAPKDRLPKLCVVGLLNQQAEDVRKAFLGTVEFVFVKSQDEGGGGHGGAGMVTKSASCDLVIAMVDHMGRDVEASSKHLKVPYHRVNGSASACKRFITAWLNGSYSGAVAQ
jgi:hypothetical protein